MIPKLRVSLALTAALAFAKPAAAAPAFIRADQLGYVTGTAARAYLMGAAGQAGVHFSVADAAGHVAFSGVAGRSTGAWGAYAVYPLDFSVAQPGRYTMSVGAGASQAIVVDNAGALYAGALHNALAFYQAQRDGADFIPGPLRDAPAHLNDSAARVFATPPVDAQGLIVGDLVPTGETVDASGGWWDAGDYLKFVETESYTVGMMLTGLRDFPDQLGPGGSADGTAEAKFGLAWLLGMWNDTSRTLYYQTGIGIDFRGRTLLSDHDLWRLAQRDDAAGAGNPDYAYINHRPVFAAGPAGAPISPNLAGRLSAAFALGFQQFRLSDPALARACIFAAEHVFDQANTRPARLLTTLPYAFYPETEWRDDMEWGATELGAALMMAGPGLAQGLPHADGAAYLDKAALWARAYIAGPNDASDTLNLYDVSGLAHFDLIRATDRNGGNPALRAALLADMLRQLDRAVATGRTDPFGFGFPWAAYDTTSHGAGLSVVADEYAFLTGDGAWSARATGWLGNIMGANAWGLSFIVGDGQNFPHCLQHQVANISGGLDGKGAILAGAAVEGPNAVGAIAHGVLAGMRTCPADGRDPYRSFTAHGARFWDNQQNYANTEPALDLTASSPLMFAWRIAGAPRGLFGGR